MNQDRSTNWIVTGLIGGLLVFSLVTTLAESGDLGSFGITVLSGLFQGMLLFLVASGLSIVFGLMDILNLAQGAYFMLGAYVAYAIHHADALASMNPDLRFLLALIVATLVGAIAGVILERGLIRPLYDRPVFQIVMTFGVAIVVGEFIRSIWGTTTYRWLSDFSIQENTFVLFGQQFSLYRLFVIVMGFVLIGLITLLLRRTRIGIIIRAGVEDSAMVEALGINVRLVFTLVFTLGCAVAAFGGGVAAPFLGASLSMGNRFLLGSIAVIVLGGLGSFEGTAIGSIIVGLALSVVDKFQLQFLNQTIWSSMTPMILLAIVLLLRPNGLYGKERGGNA
ncbi:MAG: branched-chain amino acid ABC transporter permease [Anaerolineae bacterium]|nr:branched-chain amino acid ABC transporter permease [Anaerolineae bacterium]MCA9910477.1 branched-chain amino acid ABC transporter permease [Anaerolineae bacterium]